jgi:hypothetical protein
MIRKLMSIAAVMLAVGVLFLAINLLHFHFLQVKVLMYSAFLDILIAAVIVALVLARRTALTPIEAGLAIAVAALLCVVYSILVPTLIDRSLSVYMMEKIEQRGGGIRQDAFVGIFRDEYPREHRVVDIRLTEQLTSGTVTISNGCVKLTPRGETIARIAHFYRKHLLPQKRDILGDISDDLTDPFRKSSADADYKCN